MDDSEVARRAADLLRRHREACRRQGVPAEMSEKSAVRWVLEQEVPEIKRLEVLIRRMRKTEISELRR